MCASMPSCDTQVLAHELRPCGRAISEFNSDGAWTIEYNSFAHLPLFREEPLDIGKNGAQANLIAIMA